MIVTNVPNSSDLFIVLTRKKSLNANRSARDSKPLEVIGTYNPVPQKPTNLSEAEASVAKAFKEISIDRSRVKYWLGVGAQPSDSVWRLLSMVRRIKCYLLLTS
jgi:small subunit ribosomal protein S16